MSILAFLAGILLLCSASFAAETPTWRGVLVSPERIETLKQRIAAKTPPTHAAWLALKASADANLERRPSVPETWYVPGYYRDAEGHRNAKAVLMNDANAAYELALVYRITADERYAKAAARLIDGWSRLAALRREDDSTLSFSYHFPALIFAADLIKGSASFPAEAQERFDRFLREKALPMNTMRAANNWGNWGLVLVMATAAHLRDEALFQQGVERWKQFIESQIAADGHLPHEVHRNGGRSGIWYSNFSLLPQTLAAEIARVNGVDLYDYVSPSGRSLRQAFERLAPWTRRPGTFPYFDDDAQKMHGVTYVSYYEILNARWHNEDATALLESIRPLSAAHAAPALTFTHGGLLNDDGR